MLVREGQEAAAAAAAGATASQAPSRQSSVAASAADDPQAAAGAPAAAPAPEDDSVKVGGSLLWGGARPGSWGGGSGGRSRDQQVAALQAQLRELESTRDRLSEELVRAATEAAEGQAARAAAAAAKEQVWRGRAVCDAGQGAGRLDRSLALLCKPHACDGALPWRRAHPPTITFALLAQLADLRDKLAASLELLGEKEELLEEALVDLQEMKANYRRQVGAGRGLLGGACCGGLGWQRGGPVVTRTPASLLLSLEAADLSFHPCLAPCPQIDFMAESLTAAQRAAQEAAAQQQQQQGGSGGGS